ncbi:MAG: hypothetical protein OEZ59_11795 [Deltaproteobacteria bacterium]|nr:hypothetical protein [Deltaproteobacteria bacterium]
MFRMELQPDGKRQPEAFHGRTPPLETAASGMRSHLLTGDGSTLPLAHAMLARAALTGLYSGSDAPALAVVDCLGVLDVYRLSLEARRLGADPAGMLERIQVCRAFTGYQEIRALLRLGGRFARGSLIFLLNPLPALLDDGLPQEDRRWLLQRLLNGVRFLAGRGYALQVCQPALSRHSGGTRQREPRFMETRFFTELSRCLPLLAASGGQLTGMDHGQERNAILTGNRPAGARLR